MYGSVTFYFPPFFSWFELILKQMMRCYSACPVPLFEGEKKNLHPLKPNDCCFRAVSSSFLHHYLSNNVLCFTYYFLALDGERSWMSWLIIVVVVVLSTCRIPYLFIRHELFLSDISSEWFLYSMIIAVPILAVWFDFSYWIHILVCFILCTSLHFWVKFFLIGFDRLHLCASPHNACSSFLYLLYVFRARLKKSKAVSFFSLALGNTQVSLDSTLESYRRLPNFVKNC